MSRLGCICGHVIVDQTDHLPYKASLLKDVMHNEFFDWLVTETQSYVVAAALEKTQEWLLEKGYPEDYADLQLDHGNILHDHIRGHYLGLKRDMYECHNCGRIHIETTDNQFSIYSSESGTNNEVLSLKTPSCT